MGTKTVTKENSTQTNAPPSWAAPGLAELGTRIGQIIPTMPGPQYTGEFVAPTSQLEQGVIPGMTAAAQFIRGLTPQAQAALGQVGQGPNFAFSQPQGTAGFGSYDASAIQPVVNAAIQPALRALTQQVLPSLRSSGMESGAYSSGRARDVLPNMAIQDAMGRMGEIATGIGYQDFQDQQQRMLQAYGLDTQRGLGVQSDLTQRLAMFPELLDTVIRTQTGASDIDAAAAAYDRQLRQQEIDNQLARQDYNVRYPFQGLDVAASLLGNLAQPWGTRTTQGTTTQSQGGLGQFLQAGMGLGMMALGMPGGGAGISSIFGHGGGSPINFAPQNAWLQTMARPVYPG